MLELGLLYMCVCVCFNERERERESRACVCVCASLCGERESQKSKIKTFYFPLTNAKKIGDGRKGKNARGGGISLQPSMSKKPSNNHKFLHKGSVAASTRRS
jgi:hypothetical protein